MNRRECQRCGLVTYWSGLEDEPAPCCWSEPLFPLPAADPERATYEADNELDPRDAAWLRGYMRKAIY